MRIINRVPKILKAIYIGTKTTSCSPSIPSLFQVSSLCDDVSKLFRERDQLLSKELGMMLGSDIVLSDSEQKANDIIMGLKNQELDHAFQHPHLFNLSKHFFEYKDKVKESQLFRLIQQMPKGAVLHVHDTGILSPDYVLKVTYLPNLYVCFTEHFPRFLFSENLPKSCCETQWQSMEEARCSSGNVEKFDAELRKLFTLVTDKPKEVYTDINAVWSKFDHYYIITGPLLTYKPVWEQYFYDVLKAFKEDNVMYIELRSVLPELYDLKGNVYDSVATAESYKKVLDQFVADNPDFFGAKLIYAPLRGVSAETVKDYFETARKIKKVLPDFLAGFDLVGQEDVGTPTKEFMPVLLEASKEFYFFFHAGETNWSGMTSDENLVDAILLGARRIGHAYALIKHPLLMEEVIRRDIGLEVNVISNQVLKLVEDVRNHPLATLLAQGMPVLISSDDPGIWEAEPLSHDFYVAFVGVASRHADLRVLKKLALNSLCYSMHPAKDKLIHEFEIRWTKFIDSVLRAKC